jgi:hypothetical protein
LLRKKKVIFILILPVALKQALAPLPFFFFIKKKKAGGLRINIRIKGGRAFIFFFLKKKAAQTPMKKKNKGIKLRTRGKGSKQARTKGLTHKKKIK